MDGMLEVDQADQFCHRYALVSVGRQNGKTKGVLAALIGWWLTDYAKQLGEPQSVMSTAQNLAGAYEVADILFPILIERFGFSAYESYGRKEVYLENGTRWRIVSPRPASGHGTTNDLIVADEIWNIKSEIIEGGLLPTQTARPRPFAFFTSTAGDMNSEFFRKWREKALREIEAGQPTRLYFAEWSPPANVDPTLEEWWPWANPGIGRTINMQELRDRFAYVDRSQFIRHSCNMWQLAIGSWIPHGSWEKNVTDDLMPAGGVLAIDSDYDGAGFVAVRVARRDDGRMQARSEFRVESLAELWQRVLEMMEDKRMRLAVTPGLFQLVPPEIQSRTDDWGQTEITRYTAIVRTMILEHQLLHNDQPALSEQVNTAVSGRSHGASITLSSQKSPAPIELCRCMVAAAGMSSKPAMVSRAAIGMSK
jgi:phage terminase large subunit-like protein